MRVLPMICWRHETNIAACEWNVHYWSCLDGS